MSLPISPTAVLGAVRMAGRLAGGVREAFSFDDALRGGGASEGAETTDAAAPDESAGPSGVVDLLQRTVEAIREKLTSAGLTSADEPLEMQLDADAELRIVGDHRQGAAIETLLASDPAMRSLAGRLHQAGGPRTLVIPPSGARPLGRPPGGGPA